MFDDRVLAFGLYIEGKQGERTKGGKPKYKSIEQFLIDDDDVKDGKAGTINLAALAGVRGLKIRGA